jgi:hypothetical protein
MRNGIYRIWLKGAQGATAGAVVLKDGDALACHRSHAFVGHYAIQFGRLTADVRCKRLNNRAKTVNMPDLDDFQIHVEGQTGDEFAVLTCTAPESPGFRMEFEITWYSNA